VRAKAAILVLIDMGNSILLKAARCGPHAQLDGGCLIPVRIPNVKYDFSFISY
jgi:hypothetical protein